MGSGLLPDAYVASVYDIDFGALWQQGYRAILFDVDNTLEDHRTALPGPAVTKLLGALRDMGYGMCFLSNNNGIRAARFAKPLAIPVIAKAHKPSPKGYRMAMEKLGVSPSETIFVGDQIFTDILGGNRAGVYTILVQPIMPYENAFFYVKRFFERFVLRKIRKTQCKT